MKFTLFAKLASAAAGIALSLAAGCGGGSAYGGGGGGGGGYGGGGGGGGAIDCSVSPAMGPVTIDVNLSLASCKDITYGLVLGYSTDNVSSHVIKLHVGSTVVFTNTGTIMHTADDLGTAGFPPSDTVPLAAAPANTDISVVNFSTGSISVGASAPSSGSYKANVAGIYYFGCNFHYVSNGMRTVIIVS